MSASVSPCNSTKARPKNIVVVTTRSGQSLSELLRNSGISNYSIFLDERTHTLFAYLERDEDHKMDALPEQPIMRKWWAYMGDVMATNPDGSPVVTPLVELFHRH